MKTTVALIALGIGVFALAASDPGYHLLKTIALTGDGGQDYLAIMNPRGGSTSHTARALKQSISTVPSP